MKMITHSNVVKATQKKKKKPEKVLFEFFTRLSVG